MKELFIVEGKSAHSTVQQAIDRKTQSVHALQGKLANVRGMSDAAVVANVECHKLTECLSGQYARVLVLMDPDVDGVHSSALLLSFFARYYQTLIKEGVLSIVKPPLFRVNEEGCVAAYAWSDEELRNVIVGRDVESLHTTRFKGVAQFSTDECFALLLNPVTRREVKLSL